MSHPRTIIRAVALAALCVGLSACISVLPKSKPAQTYRFGLVDGPAATQAPTAVSVLQGATTFPPAAGGDRMLTVTGTQTAYIAQARWMAAAQTLFENAVERAFDARPAGPRLVTRGEQLPATASLRIDVESFETRYLNGPETAPTVVVSLRATVVRLKDHAIMGDRVLEISKPATSNRVGSIVDAYDAAVRETVTQLAEWTAGTAG